jgi:hypothetical protein
MIYSLKREIFVKTQLIKITIVFQDALNSVDN